MLQSIAFQSLRVPDYHFHRQYSNSNSSNRENVNENVLSNDQHPLKQSDSSKQLYCPTLMSDISPVDVSVVCPLREVAPPCKHNHEVVYICLYVYDIMTCRYRFGVCS